MRNFYLILLILFTVYGLNAQQPLVKKLNEISEPAVPNLEETNRIDNAEDLGFYEKTYQGVNAPRQSVTDLQGNTYITGTSSHIDAPQGNILTIKYDAAGNLIWEKREENSDFVVEIGFAITLDEENNPIITGIKWNGDNMDILTVKYDKITGETIWSSVFDAGFSGLDYPQSITTDFENNIIVGGMSYSVNSNGAEGVGYLTLKYNSEGDLIWSALDENDIEEVWIEPYNVTTDSVGNVAITGFGSDENLYKVYYTIKYDSDGELIWKNKYMYDDNGNPTNNTASDVEFDEAGNCYVTGTFADGSGSSLMGTIKYSPTGELLWVKSYQSGNHITLGYHIGINEDAVYVAGMHREYDQSGGSILIAYSPEDGTENWIQETNNLQITGDNIGTFVQFLLADSQPVISVWGLRDFNNTVEVRKYNTDGSLALEKTYTKESVDTYSLAGSIGLGIDENEAIYLSLSPRYTEFGEVYELIKFQDNPEIPVWEKRYENMGGGNITLLDSQPGPDGSMTAIGYHGFVNEDLNFMFKYLVIHYNSNGEIAWEKLYSPEDGYVANRISVNIDETGNSYVLLTPSPYDLETLITVQKISPTGEVLWEAQKEMIFPEGYIQPMVDNEGNVYIAGTAHESSDLYQPYFNVIKFNSQGEEQWNQFISARDGDNLFQISAGEFDPTGNLVFTGHSGVGSFFSQATDVAVFQISQSGNLNWMEFFPIGGWNSGATDLAIQNDNIYLSAWKENQSEMNLGEMVILKYNSAGENIWDKTYSETGRRIRSYEIQTNSSGNIILTGFSNHISTMINRVIVLNYDAQGELVWNKSSDDLQYYRDMYIDNADNIYVLNQEYSSTHPKRIYYSLGPFTTATLMKISADGEMETEDFIGDELSPLNPVSLVPFADGRLLISTEMSNEMDHFAGIKFFETEHKVLGADDPIDHLTGNWLGQNYPNPAKSITSIPFGIESSGNVEINLYDVQGKFIRTLVKGNYPAGTHSAEINLSGLPKGIYFYQLNSQKFVQSKKLIVK
ncbi:T9SS type A sorting domain-containing protein [Moheibacter sp.]|uniref:T9SS type A sorting domain-containing protein n=1 Tax=Moheibacter sp. TaxID=1965316 RepID=UPI003C792D93